MTIHACANCEEPTIYYVVIGGMKYCIKCSELGFAMVLRKKDHKHKMYRVGAICECICGKRDYEFNTMEETK